MRSIVVYQSSQGVLVFNLAEWHRQVSLVLQLTMLNTAHGQRFAVIVNDYHEAILGLRVREFPVA